MQQQTDSLNIIEVLCNNFIDMTTPKPKTSTFTGITHPGNWPNSAVFGVEYKCHDKQFPQVKHEPEVEYFDDIAALELWVAHKAEWIMGTDYDFSMEYRVYEWDLGPEFKYMRSM